MSQRNIPKEIDNNAILTETNNCNISILIGSNQPSHRINHDSLDTCERFLEKDKKKDINLDLQPLQLIGCSISNNSKCEDDEGNGDKKFEIDLVSLRENQDLNKKPSEFKKRATLQNPPSLMMDFIFTVDKEQILKLKILLIKFLLPHLLATLFSFIFMCVQISINNLCWLNEKCDCGDSVIIKIYTLVRTIFTYWNLILLLGYYSLFIIQEIKQIKILKVLMVLALYGALFAIYLPSDGKDDNTESLYSYAFCFLVLFLTYAIIFIKVKMNIYLFKEKVLYQTLLLIILFIHLITKRYAFNLVKTSLQYSLGSLGKNIGQIVISFYSFIYKTAFKYLILKFSLRIMKEGGEYNAIIFFMRLIVCFIICINTSNIAEMELTDWGGWILILTYCIFLFEFYTRFNLYGKIYLWIKSKFSTGSLENSKANLDYENIISIKKVLSGYLFDFQFILIPRMIILYYFHHLIDYHSGDFSEDCQLRISNKFPNNWIILIIIIILNVIMPIIFFFWMHKKKEILFEFRFENYNMIQRIYVIFLFHTYFEFIFQDFLTSI